MPSSTLSSKALFTFLVSWPKSILGGFFLLTLLLGWPATQFTVDASPDTLLTKGDPSYIETALANRLFATEEFLLVAYRPIDRPLFSEQTLQDLRGLSKELKQLERVASVRSILNVPLLSLSDGLVQSKQSLAELTLEHRTVDQETLQKEFADHPIYQDLLVNKQQTTTAIQVLFKTDKKLTELDKQMIDLQKLSLARELTAAEEQQLEQLSDEAEPLTRQLDQTRTEEILKIRELIKNYQGEAEIYLGGIHVLGSQLIQIIHRDLQVFGVAILIVICVVLFLLFRKVHWVVIPLICCFSTVVSTVGLFSLFDLKTTIISSNFIALQLVLTLALVIHLIVQYRDNVLAQGELNQTELVLLTLEQKAGACFYAGFTAAVGFGSLIFSNIQPVITFGWMMIIAMFVSTLVSLILFPALLVLFAKDPAPRKQKPGQRVLAFCTYLTLKHSRLIALVCAVLVIVSVFGFTRLTVENSFINYFKSSTQIYRELSFIDQHFGGTVPLDLIYTIQDEQKPVDLLMTADTVYRLQLIQHELAQHPAIGRILSIVNFTDLARRANDDKPLTEYELTAIYWLLEDNFREDLLGSFYAPQAHQVRFNLWIKDSTEELNRAELFQALKEDLTQLDIPEDQYRFTNMFVMYQDILQRLFRSQILTVGVVYLVLLPTILLIFRSLRIATVAIIPNVLTTITVLGALGCLGIPLDLMTITIASIAMGMGVDDTIHFIDRYLKELASGNGNEIDAKEAVKRCHASVGFAMIYTTLSISLGFLLLGFSDFVPSILFGLLSSFALLTALAFNLCVLPALLVRFVRRVDRRFDKQNADHYSDTEALTET